MKKIIAVVLILIPAMGLFAQTETPTKGFLKTRVSTAGRIAFPATTSQGTEVFDTTTPGFYYNDGMAWLKILNRNEVDNGKCQ